MGLCWVGLDVCLRMLVNHLNKKTKKLHSLDVCNICILTPILKLEILECQLNAIILVPIKQSKIVVGIGSPTDGSQTQTPHRNKLTRIILVILAKDDITTKNGLPYLLHNIS